MDLSLDNTSLPVYEALANETRLEILNIIGKNRRSISDIAEELNISNAVMTKHIKILEKAQLIVIEQGIGEEWRKKYIRLKVDQIQIHFPEKIFPDLSLQSVKVKIGHFVDFYAEPSCGMATAQQVIGALDEPKSFLDQDRVNASIIWLNNGFLEYKIPNPFSHQERVEMLDISLELASEFPISNNYWPSDIDFYLNDVKIGSYTVPGNYSDVRGKYTPAWWNDAFSQYGLLKHIRINRYDTSIDGEKVSNCNLNEVAIDHLDFITFKIAVDKQAKNAGGLTIFGEHWGNHPQDIFFNFYTAHSS